MESINLNTQIYTTHAQLEVKHFLDTDVHSSPSLRSSVKGHVEKGRVVDQGCDRLY